MLKWSEEGKLVSIEPPPGEKIRQRGETKMNYEDISHVYVDEAHEYLKEQIALKAQHCGKLWCHLWCDLGYESELHQVAKWIGLKPEWFQRKSWFPHYDIVIMKRAQALRAGAKERSVKEWLKANLKPMGG